MLNKSLPDPGKGKSPAEAKVERLKAWKRPKTKAARDKQRAERIANMRGDDGNGLSISQ